MCEYDLERYHDLKEATRSPDRLPTPNISAISRRKRRPALGEARTRPGLGAASGAVYAVGGSAGVGALSTRHTGLVVGGTGAGEGVPPGRWGMWGYGMLCVIEFQFSWLKSRRALARSCLLKLN